MPNFEVLDARIASALNKIIHNSHFKRRISLEEQKPQKQDRFLRGRQIAHLIYEYFRVTGANDSVEDYADLFTISLRNDDIQEFDSKWDGILLSMTKIPPDDILEGLYKLKIRESEKLKTVARGMGSPRHAVNRRRRTNLHVCKHLLSFGWHMQGREDEFTSCRGTVQSAWQKPPVRRKGGRAGLPKKGKRPPRGTVTTVLTYPGSAPRGTGKAGENGQHSGEMGGSSPWTRPSAPECCDTLKALAGDQRPILGGDRPRRRLRGRCRLGHRPVVLLRTETAQCTVRPT